MRKGSRSRVSLAGRSGQRESWSASDAGRDWRPPDCTGWTAAGFTTLVTIAAISLYVGCAGLAPPYRGHFRTGWDALLVDDAQAVADINPERLGSTGAPPGQRREDFTPDELTEGKLLYFEQADNLSGRGIYRLQITEASPDRLVFDVENVDTLRYLFIPVLRPGEMQEIHFISGSRIGRSMALCPSIVRTGRNANRLIAGNEASSINRAVAFYRHMVGIPTDREPPAARSIEVPALHAV